MTTSKVVQTSAPLARLEPYLLLAKSASGAAAAKLIQEATAAPGCYVFTELAETDGIKALYSDPNYAQTTRLLDLFSFGTILAYLAEPASYAALNVAQLTKLRQLTVVSLASQARTLEYATLLQELRLDAHVAEDGTLKYDGLGSSSTPAGAGAIDITTLRILEDVLIDCIYAGLITGRLDQRNKKFHVDTVIGRDVAGDEELARLEAQLSDWNDITTALLYSLSERIESVQSRANHDQKKKQEHDSQLLAVLMAVQGEGPMHDSRDDHTMDLDHGGDEGGSSSPNKGRVGSAGGSKRTTKRTRT